MEQFSGNLGRYYDEIEPSVRKAIFCSLQKDQELPPIIGRLYELRYVDQKNPENEVDLFLWYLVNLLQYHSAPGLLKKKTRKDILSIYRRMELVSECPHTEEEDRILYWELRNAIRRYFGTLSAPSYGKKLFGTLSAKDDERIARMEEEAWKLSYGNAVKFDLVEESELFCRAADDEYREYFHSETALADRQTGKK